MSSWFAWLVIILCVVLFMKVSQKFLKVIICVGLIFVIITYILPQFI